MSVYTSVYTLLMSAPDVGAVRGRLAMLCKERNAGESLVYGQLLEMLDALQDREENNELAVQIKLLEKDLLPLQIYQGTVDPQDSFCFHPPPRVFAHL